jgi:hypothetical protein
MASASVSGPDRRTIWRRRVVLMAIVGLLIAIPVTIFVSGSSDAPPAESLAKIEVKAPDVGPQKVQDSLGVKLRVPEGWTRAEKQNVLELQSKDGAARVAISAPGPAADADELHSQVIAGLRTSYRDFDVAKNIDKVPVGGLKGQATIATGKLPQKKGGSAQKILVTTAEGKVRAYLVVVFTSDMASSSVLEAQALVNNLRFTK